MIKDQSSEGTSVPVFVMKFSAARMAILAAVIFLGFGVLWWKTVYANPQRVFDAMLSNSLQLQGVTRKVTQENNGQKVQQVNQLNLRGDATIRSSTTLSQGAGSDGTTVITESIGTPTTDYVSYKQISTGQKNADNEDIDFSNVLNVWGNSDGDQQSDQTDGELYNEAVLGVIPFGRLSASDRQELLSLVKSENIYEVDYKNVKREVVAGRPTYTYPVTVEAEAYIKLLKRFGEMTGLNHLDTLDPAAYAGSPRLPFTLSVDVWSRQLTRVIYDDGSRTEELSGHNALTTASAPKESISVQELQGRLQELQ